MHATCIRLPRRGLVCLAMLVCCGWFPASALAQDPALFVRFTQDGPNQPLDGQTGIQGEIFVTLDPPTGVRSVAFFLDDPQMAGDRFRRERNPPFDFNGGNRTRARAFDTGTLGNGLHTITALVSLSGGGELVRQANFEVGVLEPPPIPAPLPEFELRLSGADSADAPLDGSVVSGGIFVSLLPEQYVETVTFYLDDPDMLGAPFSMEQMAPFDFNGTTDGVPWESASVANGVHTITALVRLLTGNERVVQASFDVLNEAAPDAEPDPEPDPEPAADPGSGEPGCILSLRDQLGDADYQPLDGQTVAGDLFIAVDPTDGIASVAFHLDDPGMTEQPFRVERQAPFDFNGTSGGTPWPSVSVADGPHVVSALVELTDGTSRELHAQFSILNHPPALSFSDPSVSFRHIEGEPATDEGSVTLAISDGTRVDYDVVVEQAPWLSVNTVGDTVPATVNIAVDSFGLESGVHQATVTASAAGFEDAQLVIALRVSSLTGLDTEMASQVTRHGITWYFDGQYEVGQFVNGDYFVLGPVAITHSTPTWTGTYDGSMINPVYGSQQGYDSRWKFSSSLRVDTDDLILEPGESLVTVDSWRDGESGAPSSSNSLGIPRPAVRSAAVLTCLAEVPPAGSFRPPYGGSDKPLYSSDDLQLGLLPGLAKPSNTPSLAVMEERFEQLWLDHMNKWTNRYLHPDDSMKDYSRDLASEFNTGSLMLMLDYTDAEKETLLIRLVQIGIDQFAILQSGATYGDGGGGIGSGRKWPILLAGILLDDPEMMDIGVDYGPETALEDCQTFYVTAADLGNYPDAEIGDPVWGERHCTGYPGDVTDPGNTGYRVCCTANAWVGAVLSVHILTGHTDVDVMSLWNHDALFDYQDSYMADQDPGWKRSYSGFQEAMWDTYRDDYGATWAP